MCLGIPGQIVSISDETPDIATVLLPGARRQVSIACLVEERIAPGDWVLVHAGLALSTMSEAEARDTLALLQEMSDAFMEQEGAPARG